MGKAHRPAVPVPVRFPRALLLLACLVFGAGCRQPAKPPDGAPTRGTQAAQAGDPGVTADGGASLLATSTGTTRPSATRLALPRPTRTSAVRYSSATLRRPVIPTPTPGPALLQMTLADAEATVMSWTIPDQAPRIERSGYVAAVDAYEALEAADADVLLNYGSDSLQGYIAGTRGSEAVVGPLVLIEVSQRGLDILDDQRSEAKRQLNSCTLVPADQRYLATLVFDPSEADLVGHTLEAAPEALWAIAATVIDHVRVTATATSAALPAAIPDAHASPTPPSSTPGPLIDPAVPAIRLGVGEYPTTLADAIAAWPLVVGSSWTYRAKSHGNGVFWHAWTITETVVSAVRYGDALMEVAFIRETNPSTAGVGDMWPEVAGDRPLDRVLVRADGVLYSGYEMLEGRRSYRPLRLAEALAEPPEAPSKEAWDAPLKPIVALPLHARSVPARWQALWLPRGGVSNLLSTAGEFPLCHATSSYLGSYSASQHWLCPGVGYARHEISACGVMVGGHAVFDLIDYTIPPLVAVE